MRIPTERPLGWPMLAAAASLLSGTSAAATTGADDVAAVPAQRPLTPGWPFGFEAGILSSPAHLISGGTARTLIVVPPFIRVRDIAITLNGQSVTDSFGLTGQGWPRSLEGVITNLPLGESTLRIASRKRGWWRPRSLRLNLINHPITGPMFSGPHQQPFLCSSEIDRANAGLGPALDRDCSVETRVSFLYRNAAGVLHPYDPAASRPEDMATTTTMDGDTVDYIVRWERGTINRFIYSIATLSPARQEVEAPDLSAWNRRLIYYFQGGVGIGHYQGEPSQTRMLYDYGLSKGYAIAYSTGTKTGEHYNLELGGETATMVKDRFVTAYGNPDYTVGVGGSGGAVQQYIYAQNHPGLIDAGIPQYSYPDMVTQTIHIGDCELLERWMDLQLLRGETKWADWNNREWLEGLNASNRVANPYQELQPWLPNGSSECVSAWRGLSPLILNPAYGTAPGVTPEQQASTEWSHFADLINIYGRAPDGFASSTWDNVGVQYGLQALVEGHITADEFLDLNSRVGAWKSEPNMVQEACPFIAELCPTTLPSGNLIPNVYPQQLDPWSWRNQTAAPGSAAPAPRKEADPGAIEAALASGMVNRGDIEIPMIDWRNYLERELDMHNSHQSFATRQRLINHDGDASNQVIWFTDVEFQGSRFDQTPMALEVIDEWMRNIERRPGRGIARNKPDRAVDSCFDASGALLYAGEDAWDGILDHHRKPGPCTARFPVYRTSRIVAGAPITGDVFKCELRSVEEALNSGVYGDTTFSPAQRARLEAIFSSGVCDYGRGDTRRPPGF